MAFPLCWELHPDVLCRQYEKQASENLFLKPGDDSTIWAVGQMHENVGAPASLNGSTSTCVGFDEQVGAEIASCAAQPPFSRIQIQEADESGLSKIFRRTPHVFHIKNGWNSRSRLDVTQKTFECLCLEVGIFEAFKDNIAFMGRRFQELEVAPPRCEWQMTERRAHLMPEVRIESTYTLRYVDLNGGSDDCRPWSLRQMTIYHQHTAPGESSWVFISLPHQVLSAITQYLSSIDTMDSLERSLLLHLSFITFPIRCWRPYLIYLAKEIGNCNADITCAAPPTSVPTDLTKLRARMKHLESLLDDALLAVRTNSLTTGDVSILLLQYLSHPEVVHAAGTSALKMSLNSFHARWEKDYTVTILKLESLRCRLQSCIQMASSFSEILNGQSLSQNSQSLRSLAEEQREEARHMGILADKGRRDAIAVKGLSIITLVYLPTTVVLNFFSASFIDTSSGRMDLVGQWWMFLVIGVPLTVVTVAAWGFWMKYKLPKAEHKCPDLEKGQ